MPPPSTSNGNPNGVPSGTGGFVPGYNSMQMQAGMVPPPLQPLQPHGPSAAQMSTMLQQQAMARQYVSPHPSAIFGGISPQLPGMFTPNMGVPMMGLGHMARQRAVEEQNSMLGLAQAGSGFGARMMGGLAAGYLGGPLGYMAYEHLGIGQGLQRAMGNVFQPIVAQRERALAFQNQSIGMVTSGPMLSATGQGMSMMAAQQVSTGIGRLADSGTFRRETGGMFNRADLDRITRLSSQLGMLDQSQSADQMVREVGKISRALSNFMKIAENPDVQSAMQQMGRLKAHGFTVAEMPVAAANARTFARMAGVSVDQAMAQAERGAGYFQQVGLSGASGFNAGLGAQGVARQLAQTMSARQLNMAGGQEGIQNTFLQASASSQTIDAFLPAMLTRRGGRLAVDPDAVRQMLTGGISPADMARRGTTNIRALGGPQAMQELITRRRELQDEMSAGLSPEQQMLLPMLQARMIQRQTGTSMGVALRMIPGLDEAQARTLEQAAGNPEFMSNMMQQVRQSARERAVSRRAAARERTSFSGRVGGLYERAVEEPLAALSNAVTRPFTEYYDEEQDRDEALQMQGEGPARVVSRNRLGSRVTAASARDLLRTDSTDANALAASALARARAGARGEDLMAQAVGGVPIVRSFYGAQGFGVSRAARGGDTTRSAILEGAGTYANVAEFFGAGMTADQVNELGRGQAELAQTLADRGGTAQERHARFRGALRDVGPLAEGEGARMRAAAAGAVSSYVNSRSRLGGLYREGGTQQGLRDAVAASLRSAGMSERQVQAAVNSDDFMRAAAEQARSTATADELGNFSALESTGLQADSAFASQSADQLSQVANQSRESAAEALGLNDYLDASDDEKRGVLGLLSGRGDEADLRRKVLAAFLMAQAEDEETKTRGRQELARLQESADPDVWERVFTAVQGQVRSLSNATREDMAARVSGKSVEEATNLVNTAAAHAQQAEGADIQRARQGVLGQAAADAYTSAGGGAAGVAALRQNPGNVASSRIQRMLREGASDADIARAIDGDAGRRLDAGSSSTAEGAGVSEADQQGFESTEAMIAAISEGMESFPGAVNQLDEASRRLYETADRLADAAGIARIAGSQEAGSSDSGGFFTRLGRLF